MGSFTMKIDDISRKALSRLQLSNKAPTPLAYFEAFYEIAKREGCEQIEELNWQSHWLNKFDDETKEQLKNTRNPDEFIETLSQILKETKQTCSLEHTQQLKNLVRRLLGTIADVFSISAKNRFHLLFRSNGLNHIDSTKALATRWEHFRDSKVHIEVIKKVAAIAVHALRTPNAKGAISKEALGLSSVLMMHPQSLIEMRVLERIERILCIKNISYADCFEYSEEELRKSCIAIFQVSNLHFFGKDGDIDKKLALSKAIEILKRKCLAALEHCSVVGYYRNGFAFMFKDIDSHTLLKQIQPIVKQLEQQKFSYQGALFGFSFDVKVLDGKDVDSIATLNEKLKVFFAKVEHNLLQSTDK